MATGTMQLQPAYISSELTKTDPKSFIKDLYYRRIDRYGFIKIINLNFRFNSACTATASEWVSSFNIPSGYESVLGYMTEVVFSQGMDGANTDGVACRVNGTTVDLMFRSKPSSEKLYSCQIVYI